MKEFIFSTDHKRIGLLYLIGATTVFVAAGIAALLIRAEQYSLGGQITDNPNTYGTWLYFHGAAMILAFLIPALTGFFGNYLVPLMIGARDMAFPRANAMSLWFYYVAIIMALLSLVTPENIDLMWTGYPPYSVAEGVATSFYVFTVYLLGASTVLGGVNAIVTIFYMRAPGMKFLQMNMLVWSVLLAMVLQLIFAPVLVAAVTLLLADKHLGTHFYDSVAGGDALLYQNLFWFYGHPAVYIIMLPAFGILFEVVPAMAKRMIFNRRVAIVTMLATSLMSGDVWVHHLYVSGMPNWIRIGMMVTTLMISVPVGLLVVSLWGTLYKGKIYFNTAMLYAAASMLLFLVGGLTGIPVAIPSVGTHISQTAFVHAHFHFVMALFALFAMLAGIYFWFPKITGRYANETAGKIAFALNFIGANMTFIPLMRAGAIGMPRRYYDYPMFPELEWYHHIATYGAVLTALGMALTIATLVKAAFSGAPAPENPWNARSLEWTTASPPPPGNFVTLPKVHANWTPYNYGPHNVDAPAGEDEEMALPAS